MKTGLSVCLLLLGGGASLLADVQVVTPSNMGNWSFAVYDVNGNPCPACGSASMVTGPGTPPLGVGSANLQTVVGGGDGAAAIGYDGTALNGLALEALTVLSYSTYDTANNLQQFPYLKLYISTTGGSTANDALYFEPPYQTQSTGNPSLPDQGATAMGAWQTWNALEGGWWDDNGHFTAGAGNRLGSIADYLSLFPNATIVTGSTGFDLRLAVGYASAGQTFNGNVDNVTIGTTSGSTTFDFEPNAVPEPASIVLLAAFLFAALVARIGLRIRKRHFAA